jgi:aminoglycoside 6'-N-acetyltransferase I
MIKIQPLKSADHEEWLRMRLALWPELDDDDNRRESSEILDLPEFNEVYVAARPEGGLGGFVEVAIRDFADGIDSRPVGYIEAWYVDPDLRRQGIGRRLVQAAEAWAAEKGCQDMGSDCEDHNLVSLQAHLALGYEVTLRLIHFKKTL